MAAPLDASDPQIASSIKEILAGTINWIIFSYVPKIPTLKLQVAEKGNDAYSEVVDEKLNEGKVQYFYVRFQVVNMPKYAYIAYCGENVTGLQRGAFNSHVHEVANLFKKLQAPVHVQINARNEADFDEKKLLTQLTKAMGSNYDAGAKHQGLGGGVTNTKEGVTLHRTAQEEASKVNASRNLPTLPANRDQFWKEQNTDTNQPKQQPKGPVINPEERNKFWSSTNSSAPVSSQPANKGVAIDEAERQKFWEQQKQAEEERKTQKTGGVIETPASAPASSLKSKFEQVSKPAEPAKPAPTGKKWTPPPAAAKPAEPAKPLTSGPPKTSAPPPSAGPPKSTGPPPPAGGPPVPPKEEPSYSAPPGPPKFSAPPPPAGGPPKSTPPPFTPPPAAEPPAEDNWDEPAPEPAPAQPAWSSPVPEPEPAPEPGQDWGTGYEQPAQTGYDANAGYDAGNAGYDAGATGGDEGTVRALYTFTAEQPTDLNFTEGDYITVLDKTDPSGWWKGRDAFGNEGYFPSNFVEPV